MKYLFIGLLLSQSYLGFSQDKKSASLIKTDTSHSWIMVSKAIVTLQSIHEMAFVVFDN